MKILVSAGPTREKIDLVRYISNFSSGKMGYAIAEAAAKLGHECVLISGPTALRPPKNVKFISVESADEMFGEIRRESKNSDIIIMAAAIADYKPKKMAASKIKKREQSITIELIKNPDILEWLGKNKKKGQIIVGFAAETENLIANAKEKLIKKNVDWIAANDVSRKDAGFSSDKNEITMLSKSGEIIKLPLQSKKKLAVKILSQLLISSTNKPENDI